MYRQHEDACPDCLQLLSQLLAQAQAYVAHLGTLRPTNQFKKDDDLHGGIHNHPWPHSAAASARVQLLHPSPQVAGVAVPPVRTHSEAYQPSVYDAYMPTRTPAPSFQGARDQSGSMREAASFSQAMMHDQASYTTTAVTPRLLDRSPSGLHSYAHHAPSAPAAPSQSAPAHSLTNELQPPLHPAQSSVLPTNMALGAWPQHAQSLPTIVEAHQAHQATTASKSPSPSPSAETMTAVLTTTGHTQLAAPRPIHSTSNSVSQPSLLPISAISPAGSSAPSEEHLFTQRCPDSPQNVREVPFHELELHEVVGEGAFGKVYRAVWLGAVVAVKVMASEVSQRGDCVHQFRREVETMSAMSPHKHVLQMMGACTTGSHFALVTEFCPRGSMYQLLHAPAVHLSWRQIYFMCAGVAKGMAHLHSQNILHRDLKSGNLLVDAHLCVKVADFGLSKIKRDLHPLTGGLGTYQWMAPEVISHSRYTESADVYSFGIVLWECAARQVPYPGQPGFSAAVGVMTRGLRPEVPDYTPAAFAALMRRCWAALPSLRPSFREVAQILTRLHRDVP